MITALAFYAFAAVLIASAAMVVTARNPVHSVLFLILAFFNAAALFLIAAVSIAGLPPLSGFIGKLRLLEAVPDAQIGWVWAVILGSSLMVIIGLSRTGTRLFWRVDATPSDVPAPALRRAEVTAVLVLLGYGIAMTVFANPILRYTDAAAAQLLDVPGYIDTLRETAPQIREPSP